MKRALHRKLSRTISGGSARGAAGTGALSSAVSKPALQILSVFYGGGAKIREGLFGKRILETRRLPGTVISVGNLTVGGTGKTPMTLYMAELVRGLGYKTAILSRGYKGRFERRRGIVSDGRRIFLDADAAGDEPVMMARKLPDVPVLVGKNRFQTGRTVIERFGAEVILLDDAYQHLPLYRDLNLLLLDRTAPFGNSHLIPRGNLREPLSALKRADAAVLTRSRSLGPVPRAVKQRLKPGVPIFQTFFTPCIATVVPGSSGGRVGATKPSGGSALPRLRGKRVFAFSGIANNDDFHHTLKKLGCRVSGVRAFPDHHRFSAGDVRTIIRSAGRLGVDVLVTTEKDFVRIPPVAGWPVDLVVVGIAPSFGDRETEFTDWVASRIEAARSTR